MSTRKTVWILAAAAFLVVAAIVLVSLTSRDNRLSPGDPGYERAIAPPTTLAPEPVAERPTGFEDPLRAKPQELVRSQLWPVQGRSAQEQSQMQPEAALEIEDAAADGVEGSSEASEAAGDESTGESGQTPAVGTANEEVNAEAAAPVKTYVVRSGDSLGSIAAAVYGNPALWTRLSEANPGLDPNRLRVGMELKVPGAP